MADLNITGVSLPVSAGITDKKIGEAAGVGAFKVLREQDNMLYLADATSADNAKALYFSLLAGAQDQFTPVIPLTRRTLVIFTGPTLVTATRYVLSANPGNIAEVGDLVSTNYRTDILIGQAADRGDLYASVTGIVLP